MNLPEDFIRETRALMGDGLYGELDKGLRQQPPVSIRMNPLKCTGMAAAEDLQDGGVAWCKDGAYLRERPNFTFDPLLHGGAYYVQEASSMFIQHVLLRRNEDGGLRKGHSPLLVLDLCAAPGGKSTAVRAVLPEGSVLISNEPVRQRAQVLAENIQKFGHPDVIVTNNYARDFAKAGFVFDIIICDVPCSGEGMFRKDGGAAGEWSMQNVEKCRTLQREIVSDIWECLRPGGLLIYSTCTFNSKENEENAEWIASELGAEFVEVPVEDSWNITGALVGNIPVYRFLPGKTRGEGLFMAVLRKEESGETIVERGERIAERDKTFAERGKRKEEKGKRMGKDTAVLSLEKLAEAWLADAGSFHILQEQDNVVAIPKAWEHIYNKVKGSLKILHAGITLGTIKGKDIVPDQSLALSVALDRAAFPTVDVCYGQAIAYLRKETIALPVDTPRGFVLLSYRGMPLGFVKNIGNRANNLYPQEWKIKSTYIPEEPKILHSSF